ncbi:MAG TPA: cobalamin-binding protein, partial [Burkholderiales bacterium]|nr:cobalamin-binding protein [Burkholderiales bacterium]
LAFSAAAQPVTVKDDRGALVTVNRPVQRVVALAPHLTELAYAAGAGEKLVGVARHSDYPAAATRLPQVGDAVRVDAEAILALKPDLVLAWRSGNPPAALRRLEQIGLPVLATEPARLSDIPRLLRAIGTLAGTGGHAQMAATDFEGEIQSLRERYAKAPRLRVFYVIWHKPLLTVSGAHLISEILSLCGGDNVFADLAQLTPNITLEALIAAKPEAILGGASAGGERGFAEQWRASAVPPLRDLPAYYINPDLIQRPTPRIVAGVKAVCSALEDARRPG